MCIGKRVAHSEWCQPWHKKCFFRELSTSGMVSIGTSRDCHRNSTMTLKKATINRQRRSNGDSNMGRWQQHCGSAIAVTA